MSFEKENEIKPFKMLIIQKCQSTFESATGQEINFVGKKEEIDLCNDPVIDCIQQYNSLSFLLIYFFIILGKNERASTRI